MDRTERQRIYDLLSRYFPNARQLKDKKTLTAWGLALERFAYHDVKRAVISYAISNKYFPDVADITAGLAIADPAADAAPATPNRCGAVQARAAALFRQMLTERLGAHSLAELHRCTTGADYLRWSRECGAAGVDVPALCERAHQAAVADVEVIR